jgi:hypothetical protein
MTHPAGDSVPGHSHHRHVQPRAELRDPSALAQELSDLEKSWRIGDRCTDDSGGVVAATLIHDCAG